MAVALHRAVVERGGSDVTSKDLPCSFQTETRRDIR